MLYSLLSRTHEKNNEITITASLKNGKEKASATLPFKLVAQKLKSGAVLC